MRSLHVFSSCVSRAHWTGVAVFATGLAGVAHAASRPLRTMNPTDPKLLLFATTACEWQVNYLVRSGIGGISVSGLMCVVCIATQLQLLLLSLRWLTLITTVTLHFGYAFASLAIHCAVWCITMIRFERGRGNVRFAAASAEAVQTGIVLSNPCPSALPPTAILQFPLTARKQIPNKYLFNSLPTVIKDNKTIHLYFCLFASEESFGGCK